MFLYVQTDTHTQYPQPIHGGQPTYKHPSNGQVCTNVSSIYTYTAADIAASVMAFAAECNTFPHTFLLIRTM